MSARLIYRRDAVTCPWEVWVGRTFIAAYQTEREALGRLSREEVSAGS